MAITKIKELEQLTDFISLGINVMKSDGYMVHIDFHELPERKVYTDGQMAVSILRNFREDIVRENIPSGEPVAFIKLKSHPDDFIEIGMRKNFYILKSPV